MKVLIFGFFTLLAMAMTAQASLAPVGTYFKISNCSNDPAHLIFLEARVDKDPSSNQMYYNITFTRNGQIIGSRKENYVYTTSPWSIRDSDRATLHDFVAHCESHFGHKETVTIASGTYETCRVGNEYFEEVEEGITEDYWIGEVPGGDVKSLLTDSNGSSECHEFIEGSWPNN